MNRGYYFKQAEQYIKMIEDNHVYLPTMFGELAIAYAVLASIPICGNQYTSYGEERCTKMHAHEGVCGNED